MQLAGRDLGGRDGAERGEKCFNGPCWRAEEDVEALGVDGGGGDGGVAAALEGAEGKAHGCGSRWSLG